MDKIWLLSLLNQAAGGSNPLGHRVGLVPGPAPFTGPLTAAVRGKVEVDGGIGLARGGSACLLGDAAAA
ncbi:hypothetical protein V6N12_045397 [Hibiscus sabdariffa]|uniref:Uncharacterized protein n=1 Tax=Hibiscus sabdariffa TaxID=183260 RepID=A0ABR2G389_9ROSI